MDTEQQYKRFLELARGLPVDDHVPYAFERRIMAGIQARRGETAQTPDWTRGLLWALLPCVVVMLIATATFASVQLAAEPVFEQPPDELALAVLAPIRMTGEEW